MKTILVDELVTKRIAGVAVRWGNETESELIFNQNGSPELIHVGEGESHETKMENGYFIESF